MKNKCVVLMPASQYRIKSLYRHVETFELANPKLFEDAEITKGLSICKLKKTVADKYTWNTLLFESLDQDMRSFYEWNIAHNKGLTMSRKDSKLDKPQSDLNYKVDFVDSGRVMSYTHGAIPSFRKEGVAYSWNYTGTHNNEWLHCLMVIRFTSEKAKFNFMRYAYNYKTLDERKSHLCGRALGGCYVVTASSEYYFAIPQIDWASISDKYPDYEKDPDYYVLKEMGLKWKDGIIIKDESILI